jgi:hypothetical protein
MNCRYFAIAATVLGVLCFFALANTTTAAEADRLLKVTIECDEEFVAVPFECLGVDIVNANGRGKNAEAGTKRMTIECLPNAVLWVCIEDSKNKSKPETIVRLGPEDDGQTVRLRFEDYVAFRNDVPCTIQCVKEQTAAQRDRLLGLVKSAVQGNKAGGLTLSFPVDDSGLPIVEQLKGSGVGIVLDIPADAKKKTISKKVLRGVAEAKPKFLALDCETLAMIDGPLSSVECLQLDMDESSKGVTPDLSAFAQLQYLFLGAKKEVNVANVKLLAKLPHLKGLTVIADRCTHADAIGSLTGLQFFTLWCEPPDRTPSFDKLTKLRYLAAAFPVTADFSFVEKTPDLRTLCILGVEPKHNLTPLEKATQLRCLALATSDKKGKKKPDFREFSNVKEFQKARPDVEVVEYWGICLGSIWMLGLAALAAVAAWVVRRCRRGNRLACQR